MFEYNYSNIKKDISAPEAGQPFELFTDYIAYREQVQFLFSQKSKLTQ